MGGSLPAAAAAAAPMRSPSAATMMMMLVLWKEEGWHEMIWYWRTRAASNLG